MVCRGIRVRIWNTDQRQVRIVGTPVDNIPGTLNLVTRIRYYGEYFVFIRNAHLLTILSEENWLAVAACSVTLVYDHIVREGT
ncbi:MAG: hypothetical protein R2792_01550 [Saprospiraceae bacterium]